MLSRYIVLPDSSVLINLVEGCLPKILLETFEGRVYVAPSVSLISIFNVVTLGLWIFPHRSY